MSRPYNLMRFFAKNAYICPIGRRPGSVYMPIFYNVLEFVNIKKGEKAKKISGV